MRQFLLNKLPLIGALVLCTAMAGTSGAVAAQLITSKDIANGTIKSRDLANNGVKYRDLAPGSVNWQKVLSKKTKQRITTLAGADGAGRIVGFNRYFLDTGGEPPQSGELPSVPLEGQYDDIVLTEPGSYLVTLHGLTGQPGALVAGELDEFNAIFRGCLATVGVQPEIPLAACDSTYTLGVGEEDVALPVSFAAFGDGGGFFGAYAEISVIRLGGTVPRDEPPLRQLAPQLRQDLRQVR